MDRIYIRKNKWKQEHEFYLKKLENQRAKSIVGKPNPAYKIQHIRTIGARISSILGQKKIQCTIAVNYKRNV